MKVKYQSQIEEWQQKYALKDSEVEQMRSIAMQENFNENNLNLIEKFDQIKLNSVKKEEEQKKPRGRVKKIIEGAKLFYKTAMEPASPMDPEAQKN